MPARATRRSFSAGARCSPPSLRTLTRRPRATRRLVTRIPEATRPPTRATTISPASGARSSCASRRPHPKALQRAHLSTATSRRPSQQQRPCKLAESSPSIPPYPRNRRDLPRRLFLQSLGILQSLPLPPNLRLSDQALPTRSGSTRCLVCVQRQTRPRRAMWASTPATGSAACAARTTSPPPHRPVRGLALFRDVS